MAQLLCKTPIFERKDTVAFVTPDQSNVEAGAVTSNLPIIIKPTSVDGGPLSVLKLYSLQTPFISTLDAVLYHLHCTVGRIENSP